MSADHEFLIPDWPHELQSVDLVKVRFVLNFISSCRLQPAVFLELGRSLRLAGRSLLVAEDSLAIRQWQDLFQPTLSDDPIARRKFQKPAPAFVLTMPVSRQLLFAVGDRLDLEVLFIGAGVPLIPVFLRSLIHLGHLGMVAGEGCFEVAEALCSGPDHAVVQVWRQNQPLEALACPLQSLSWYFRDERIPRYPVISFKTPTRLLVDGKPLRKPRISQIFPFMLRRVTSMLHAHGGIEVVDDPTPLLDQARTLEEVSSNLLWHDWQPLKKRQGLSIGGFRGDMTLSGQAIRELYWILAVASLLGIGKGATYGAGRFELGA